MSFTDDLDDFIGSLGIESKDFVISNEKNQMNIEKNSTKKSTSINLSDKEGDDWCFNVDEIDIDILDNNNTNDVENNETKDLKKTFDYNFSDNDQIDSDEEAKISEREEELPKTNDNIENTDNNNNNNLNGNSNVNIPSVSLVTKKLLNSKIAAESWSENKTEMKKSVEYQKILSDQMKKIIDAKKNTTVAADDTKSQFYIKDYKSRNLSTNNSNANNIISEEEFPSLGGILKKEDNQFYDKSSDILKTLDDSTINNAPTNPPIQNNSTYKPLSKVLNRNLNKDANSKSNLNADNNYNSLDNNYSTNHNNNDNNNNSDNNNQSLDEGGFVVKKFTGRKSVGASQPKENVENVNVDNKEAESVVNSFVPKNWSKNRT